MFQKSLKHLWAFSLEPENDTSEKALMLLALSSCYHVLLRSGSLTSEVFRGILLLSYQGPSPWQRMLSSYSKKSVSPSCTSGRTDVLIPDKTYRILFVPIYSKYDHLEICLSGFNIKNLMPRFFSNFLFICLHVCMCATSMQEHVKVRRGYSTPRNCKTNC